MRGVRDDGWVLRRGWDNGLVLGGGQKKGWIFGKDQNKGRVLGKDQKKGRVSGRGRDVIPASCTGVPPGRGGWRWCMVFGPWAGPGVGVDGLEVEGFWKWGAGF